MKLGMKQSFAKLSLENRRADSGTQPHNFFTAQIDGSGNSPAATKQFQGEAQIESSDNIPSNDTVPTRRTQFVDTGNKKNNSIITQHRKRNVRSKATDTHPSQALTVPAQAQHAST